MFRGGLTYFRKNLAVLGIPGRSSGSFAGTRFQSNQFFQKRWNMSGKARAYDGILDFWFPKDKTQKEMSKIWFNSDPSFDETLKKNFGNLLEEISADRTSFQDWKTTLDGRVAYIVLTDQFSRNIYRGSGKAFSFDDLALDACQEIMDKEGVEGLLEKMTYGKVMFILMPLMHSEDRKVADLSVETWTKVDEIVKSEASKNNLDYAKKHFDIVERFGRYPHRNEAMGRENTAEEEKYLESADRFGQ